jgi:tRNA A37 threonylcarbamoyladenosine modification protein TsaB
MITLYVERSTDKASVAIGKDGVITSEAELESVGMNSGAWAREVRDFIGGVKLDDIVVGTGPGSFAGIRAALAFAQGYAIGSGCSVRGLPSPCAFAPDEGPLAVVGDARRGKYWIALFDGPRLVTDIFQVDGEMLHLRVPIGVKVVTPDAARIDSLLRETFGSDYAGAAVPTAAGLSRALALNPSLAVFEPLPVYLNPAVRD